MKKLLLTILLLSLLAACAPAPVSPTGTAIPINTNTPKPTTTPLPTLTPTPTLEPWMQSLPENVVSVEQADGEVFGLDKDGKLVMRFLVRSGEWEKVYTSGVDQDLLAEIVSDAEIEFGMSISEKLDEVVVGGVYDQGVVFNPEEGRYRQDMMLVGMRRVSVKERLGSSESILNMYFVTSGSPDILIPVTTAFGDSDELHITGSPVNADLTSMVWGAKTLDEFENLIGEKTSLGDVFMVNFVTFGDQIENMSQIESVNQDGHIISNLDMENVQELLSVQDDYIIRMTEISPVRAAGLLDANKDDLGLIAQLFLLR